MNNNSSTKEIVAKSACIVLLGEESIFYIFTAYNGWWNNRKKTRDLNQMWLKSEGGLLAFYCVYLWHIPSSCFSYIGFVAADRRH